MGINFNKAATNSLAVAGLATLLSVMPAKEVEAAPYNFTAHGTVSSLSSQPLAHPVPLGTPVSVNVTFDGPTPDAAPDFPEFGLYNMLNVSGTYTVGANTYNILPDSLSLFVLDGTSPSEDFFGLSFISDGAPNYTTGIDFVASPTTVNSDNLSELFTAFVAGNFAINSFGSSEMGDGRRSFSMDDVSASLSNTSVTSVPGSNAALNFAGGLFGLAAVGAAVSRRRNDPSLAL